MKEGDRDTVQWYSGGLVIEGREFDPWQERRGIFLLQRELFVLIFISVFVLPLCYRSGT